jgi:hypothetical protein
VREKQHWNSRSSLLVRPFSSEGPSPDRIVQLLTMASFLNPRPALGKGLLKRGTASPAIPSNRH